MDMFLNSFWMLVGGGAALYLLGIFSSQWVKDKITGVPAELRAALSASETAALQALSDAKSRVISDVTSFFAPTPVPVTAPVAAPVAVPVTAAAPVVVTAHPYLHEHPAVGPQVVAPVAPIAEPASAAVIAPSIIMPAS